MPTGTSTSASTPQSEPGYAAGDSLHALQGVVTQANGGFAVGQPVRILAQTRGDTTAIALAIGDLAFAGAGLVVIAIIAVIIGLLLPAVQKENR